MPTHGIILDIRCYILSYSIIISTVWYFNRLPTGASHHRQSILEFALCRTYTGLIREYQDPNKEETKYHTFLILLPFGCYILMLFIRSICLYMCYRYTYIYLWIRRVIIWKLINLTAYIYSGSRLCPGLGLGVQAIASRDLSLHAHTALQISGHCFWGLIIMRSHDTSDITPL